MKTYYLRFRSISLYSILGLFGILATSCGSYQNASYDNDGIYGEGQQKKTSANRTADAGTQYKDYFSSLQATNDVEIFTDVDNYATAQDTTQPESSRGYTTGYSSWGSDTDNVTVNVYPSNWGYGLWNNYWYGPSYGWGWNAGWGWNNWYGPSYGFGWGWNNWYGPAYGYYGWNNYYGNGWHNHHHYNNYAYNGGTRGVRSELGSNGRNGIGRSYAQGRTRGNTYTSGTRNSISNGTRNSTYSTTRNTVRNTSGTRSQTFSSSTTTRQSQPSTRSNSTYSPSGSSTRSYSPSSSGGGRSSGGGSYGGGGGRSSGGGGRR
ncbi:MAG TPA: hypothetical protein VF581_09970 [Flavobacterium sp.]